MSYVNPGVQDFKDYFNRDFPYGSTPDTVMDADIVKAEAMASMNINPNLSCNQSSYTINFLYLSAHFLVLNLRASSQGIAGNYSWLQSSKSVASVAESYSIPERVLENPNFAMLAKTNYGAQYLYNVLPFLVGQVYTVQGTTRA